MTRPQPAPHAIDVPHRGQLPFQQFDNERAGRVGSDAKKCTRVTPIYPKGGAPKKSECTYGLRSSKTTIVPIIAASVAMTNAVLFFQLLVSPGHTMDSNTAIDSNADQSVARGHCRVFVVRDFLRKSDVLRSRVIDRLARRPSRHRARGEGSRRVLEGDRTTNRHQHRSRQMFPRYARRVCEIRNQSAHGTPTRRHSERESTWRLQGPQGKHRPHEIMQMTAENKGPSASAKALKIGRASVYRALASWRGHDHQAPIGFAVRGSSHRKGFFRHSLGKGRNSGSTPTILAGGSQHPPDCGPAPHLSL